MIKTISIKEFQKQFPRILREGLPVRITRRGRPVATIRAYKEKNDE